MAHLDLGGGLLNSGVHALHFELNLGAEFVQVDVAHLAEEAAILRFESLQVGPQGG